MYNVNDAWKEIYKMWQDGLLNTQEAITAQEFLYYSQHDYKPFTFGF